jgi:hypothetical protein
VRSPWRRFSLHLQRSPGMRRMGGRYICGASAPAAAGGWSPEPIECVRDLVGGGIGWGRRRAAQTWVVGDERRGVG